MVKTEIARATIKGGLKIIHSNPEKALPMMLDIADKVAEGQFKDQRETIREVIENKDSCWYGFILKLLTEIDEGVLDTFVTNFITNASLIGWKRQLEIREKYNCNVPWAILLDPTSACNLKCKGCWAADYGNRLNLSFEDICSIIDQGKELGIYMYIYTGGEPLVRKKDIIRLCEKYSECIFLCFTNGTLIDEEFCQDMLRVKNFVPAISVEGDETTTDSRRGEGTYAAVVRAMNLLKSHRLAFGISCCYTSANMETVTTEEYYDQMIDWGALFVWYFHYMPVGSDAAIDLMVSPEQREEMYHRVRKFRETKPIFGMDFQNDAEFVQGCIAGGRRYLHINAAGDVDPCVFIHFSDSNIHEKTLLEALRGPLFQAYHDGQPFNDNMLRPCPMLENPEKLRAMIKETGAHSTNLEGLESVEELCSRCDRYAEHWKPYADKIWAENPVEIIFEH